MCMYQCTPSYTGFPANVEQGKSGKGVLLFIAREKPGNLRNMLKIRAYNNQGILFAQELKWPVVIHSLSQCLSQTADCGTLARVLFQCRAKINHPRHHVATKY